MGSPMGGEEAGFYTFELKRISENKAQELLEEIRALESVVHCGPLLSDDEFAIKILREELILQFYNNIQPERIEEILSENNLEIVETMPVGHNLFLVRPRTPDLWKTLEVANHLMEEYEEVRFSEPNSHSSPENDVWPPTDFYYPEKWDLQLMNVQGGLECTNRTECRGSQCNGCR